MKPQWQRRFERLERTQIINGSGTVVRVVTHDPQQRHRMPPLPKVGRG